MRVLFRTDASVAIGTGHVMRCVVLADEFLRRGATVSFICREHDGHLADFLRRVKKLDVITLPASQANTAHFQSAQHTKDATAHAAWLGASIAEDAAATVAVIGRFADVDLLVVDHYAIAASWEALIKPRVKKLMVIDDLADRNHCADIILDQNYYHDHTHRYDKLVPAACQKLLGPKFALLSPHFTAVKKTLLPTPSLPQNLLVFFGGSDPEGVTLKAIAALKKLTWNKTDVIEILAGPINPERTALQKLCADFIPARLHLDWVDMAKSLSTAKLILGAGGITTWERSFFGVPAIVIATAKIQMQIAKEYSDAGAQRYLGWWQDVSTQNIADAVTELWNNTTLQESQRQVSQHYVDGLGLQRVMAALTESALPKVGCA